MPSPAFYFDNFQEARGGIAKGSGAEDMAVAASRWAPPARGTEEFFFVVTPRPGGTFPDQMEQVFAQYEDTLRGVGLDASSLTTATVFLSDSANQEAGLRDHAGFARMIYGDGAVTVVQQPPASGKIGLLAYHVRRPAGAEVRMGLTVAGAKAQASALSVAAEPYRFTYLKNLLSRDGTDAASQAEDLLGFAGHCAQSNGVALAEVVRTWLYVNDVDANYGALSEARNRVFARHGIDTATGFPASTGIEGRSADHRDVIMLDLVAIRGLQPGQCRGMAAPGFMNPTVEYGVTFERGREVVYGDRRHLYVSGTASIDESGKILHLGDVRRQTRRAIDNVAALLGNSGAGLADMRHLIVYLRDMADAETVEAVVAATALAAVPRIIVRAPVCRPGWLVEMEGMAIDGRGEPRFAAF